jgi:hypothetical protein
VFTIDEANALVPRVAHILGRTTQMLGRVRASMRRLAAEGIAVDGGLPDASELGDRPELLHELELAHGLAGLVREEARVIEGWGIIVRDLDRGLLDFPSIVDGEREVHLCWHLGEREIGFFHEIEAGFAGRQPVDGHRFFRSRQLRAPSE